jgi:Zn finger protein HypA/HybF involved in hydrogenase expression
MAIPNIKEIFELIKKGATLEAQQKIIELKETAISLQEENLELKKENLSLKQQIELLEKGDRCPKCRKASWNLIKSQEHPGFGSVLLDRIYKCSECGFTETQIFNPYQNKR